MLNVIAYKKDGEYNRLEVYENNKRILAEENTDNAIAIQLDLLEKLGAEFELIDYN